ncbi:MAG: hypothetical protein FJ265_05975 [Planctomycetes bacterium]|nr:hypothetical protein [Planctomycetota bacterium]
MPSTLDPRNLLPALAAALSLSGAAGAQVSTAYVFTQTAGTFVPITGGTLVAAATGLSGIPALDDNNYAVTLPFGFVFDGATYSAATVNTNGHLTFGTTLPSTFNYTPLSATTTYNGAIAPFGSDLMGGWLFTGDRTVASNQVTNVSAVGPLQVGDFIGGTGIPAGTTITVIAGNVLTLSANATAAATGTYLFACGPWCEIRTETLGSAPNRTFVVQWSNFRRYTISALTTAQHMVLNFQVRLGESSGRIEIVYGNCSPGLSTTTTVVQVGLRGPNNAFPANINNRMNVKGTSDWATSTAGTANTSGEVFNDIAPANVIPSGLTYLWAPAPIATNVAYGTGCYTRSATWYESFTGPMDLAGIVIRMTNVGTGYLMTPGAPTAYVHTAPGLALTDDSVATVALPSPFTYSGGVTSSIGVCSNGYIWMQQPNGLADWTPTVAELFSNPARLCPSWADLLPDGAANVNNVFAEADPLNPAMFYVTWNNVPLLGGGGSVNLQVQFDLTSGDVNITYGAMPATATCIVGWTPGIGASVIDPGNRDLSATIAAGFLTGFPELVALALSASPRPVLGTTVTYTVDNIPPSAAISALLVSLLQANIELTGIGAPGCFQHIDLGLAATALLIGSPTASFGLPLPNNLSFVGLPLFVQGASLVPGANPLNVITSNGVRSTLSNL